MTGQPRSASMWDTVPMVAHRPVAHDGDIVGEGAPTVGRWHDELGATAVEYGLVVGAVGIAFIVAGPMLQDAFAFLLNVVLCDILGGGATCA